MHGTAVHLLCVYVGMLMLITLTNAHTHTVEYTDAHTHNCAKTHAYMYLGVNACMYVCIMDTYIYHTHIPAHESAHHALL